MEVRQKIGDKSGVSTALEDIGELLLVQGDLSGAHKKIEEALAISSEIGEQAAVAQRRRTLAAVLIEEGQATRAETLAKEAADKFGNEKDIVSEALARSVLARSQLAQGKLSEARQSIEDATKLLSQIDQREVRLAVITSGAQVRAASGSIPQAVKSLEAVITEAAKFRIVDAGFEARLALGEIEMKSSQNAAGHTRLTALEKDATAKDFLLIARKARALETR